MVVWCPGTAIISLLLTAILSAPHQADAQQGYLHPSYAPDQDRGSIVFFFNNTPPGVHLRCSFKNGPRNVNCTTKYELNTEILSPGDHVMDITGYRVTDNQQIGKVTEHFIIAEKFTLNIRASVKVTGYNAKLCFLSSRSARFRCRFGDGAWSSCSSCTMYSELCPGSYQVEVEATSTVNPKSKVGKNESFEITATDLQAELRSSVNERNIRMCFNASRESKFECRINSASWRACSSCHSVSNLCPGYYHTEVRATSVHCPDITTVVGKHLKVGPSLEITTASLDVGCTSGRYALESNIAALWRCKVDGQPWGACSNGMMFSGLVAGSHSVSVEARSLCNQSERVQKSFGISVPGRVRIDNVRVRTSGARDSLVASFTTCSLTESFCKVDSGSYRSCTSPFPIPSEVKPGTHVLHLKSELNGVLFATHQLSFFKEMVLRITGSTEVDGHAVSACFQSNYRARFQCRVDGAAWEPCRSCVRKNDICPGQHQFWVRGTSVDNSTVSASTRFPFTVTDRSVHVDVRSVVAGSNVRVCFTASRRSRFECQMDSGRWQSCSSCTTYNNVCAGQHIVRVRAVSSACASVTGSAQTRFQVESDLRITEAGMTVDCDDGVYALRTNQPASLRCRRNGESWNRCYNSQKVSNLPLGTLTVEVEAALQCNPSIRASKTLTLDVPDNVKVGDLEVSKYDGGRVVATFDACEAAMYQCKVDNVVTKNCTSPFLITGELTPGEHSIEVMALRPQTGTSGQGQELDSKKVIFNIALEVQSSVVVDGSNAVVCFTSSHDGASRCKLDGEMWTKCMSCARYSELCPGVHTVTVNTTAAGVASYSNVSTSKFEIAAKDLEIKSTAVVNGEDASICMQSTRAATFECQLDGGSWRECSSCANYTGLCAGQHVVNIRGVSTFCPSVTGSSVQRFQTTPDFKFVQAAMRIECDEGVYSLETSHPSKMRCRVGTSTWSSCTDGSVVKGLRLGSHRISVEASLLCNTAVKITRTFIVSAPDNVVIPSVETTYNSLGELVATFPTCPLATYMCSVDRKPQVRCTSPHVWRQRFQPGSHTMRIQVSSGRTNFGQASVEFNTALTTNSSVVARGSTAVVCFTASHRARFECKLDQEQWETCSSCYTYAELCPGQHVVQVRSTSVADKSIQTLSQNNFVITDNSIAITAVPKVSADSVNVCFTSSRQATLQCRLDTNQWRSCSSCETFRGLCAGAHSVSVRAVSSRCSGVQGTSVTNFEIESNLEITQAEMEVECTTAMYRLSANQPSSMRCRIDNKMWLPCASGGVVTGLGRGDHLVEVEAALECNPQIKTTRTMSFTSPNSIVPPAIQVASKDNVKVFSFDVCETADYQCQVDSAERTTCSSPFTVSDSSLTPGDHSVTVFALSGDSVLIQRTVSFTVDLHLSLNVMPAGSMVTLCPNVSHTALVECRIDDGNWAECSECVAHTKLCPGPHTAAVQALANGVRREKTENFVVNDYGVAIELTTSLNEDHFTACFSGSMEANYECRLSGSGQWHHCENCSSYSHLCTDEYTFDVRASSIKCPKVKGSTNHAFSVRPSFDFVKAEMEVECSTGKYALMTTEPSTLQCRMNGAEWIACANDDVIEGLPAGALEVEVEASLSCNPSVKARTTFTVEVPDNVLVGEVTVSTEDGQVAAEFHVCSVAEYYCRVDDREETKCISPFFIPRNVPSGDHMLTVSAKASDTVLSSSQVSFHVEEQQAITATVDVKKCGAILNVQTNLTNIVCICYLDNDETGQSCTSGQAYKGLSQGKHQVRIEAVVGGKVMYEKTVKWENTHVCREGAVYASVRIRRNSATLHIYVGPPDTTYVCRLDGGAWQTCKHGTVFNDLEEGSHGIDLETRSFMYKKTRKHLGPFVIRVPLFRASGEATVSRNNVTLHFNTSEPASFLCKMDHLAWETCQDGSVYVNLPPGSHLFQVRATARSSGRTVGIGLGPILVGKKVSGGQCNLHSYVVASQGQVTLHVRSLPAGLYSCRIDTNQWTPCYDGMVFHGVAVGTHVIEVRMLNTLCSALPPLKVSFTMAKKVLSYSM